MPQAAVHVVPYDANWIDEYRADVMHWFCKPSAAVRTHHVHLIPTEARCGTNAWRFVTYSEAIRNWLKNTPS
jgi:hypothetical protein